jgi:hypothetical protein
MVEITFHGDRVRFNIQGWDKLWSVKSELDIPIAHVRAVRIDPEPARGWFHGIRVPGTDIPHVITAGTFYQKDGWVFFDVHDPDKTIVLDLDHEHYKRLVIEVADPATSVASLEDALAHNARVQSAMK